MNTAPANRHYESKIVTLEEIASDVFEIKLSREEAFSFQPGQYVWIAVLDETGKEIGRRPFSIASTPSTSGTISIITNRSESVFKKELLKKKPGDTLLMVGPFGSTFLLPEDETRPLVLIAGGLGIAPFLSLIRHARERNSTREINLFYTEDTPERMVYQEELHDEAIHPNIHIFSSSKRLRAKDIAPLIGVPNIQCYVSGPQGFVDATGEILSSYKLPATNVGYEGMYPSLQKDQEFHKLFKNGKFAVPTGKISPQAQQLILIIRTIESSSNHVIITDRSGIILFANKTAEKLTGFSTEEIIGNTPRLWGGMMDPSFYKSLWQKKLSGEPAREKIINRRKNGEIYSVYSNIAPIKDTTGSHVVGWIATEEDITEIESQKEKLIEQGAELEKSKSALLNILEDLEIEKKQIEIANAKNIAILTSIQDGIVFIDGNGKILFANKSFESMLSWKEEATVGKNLTDVIEEEDHLGNPLPLKEKTQLQDLAEILTVTTPNYHYLIRKDGTKFPALSVVTPVTVNKTTIGAVLLFRDVSKEKELEKAKSEFVSIASHQLRTPLTGIRWVSEYLLKKLKLPQKSKSYLQDIHSSTARLADLLDILLNLARIEEGAIGTSPQPIELVSFIQGYLDECTPLLDKKKLRLSFETSHSEINARTDVSAMRNIIQSLVSNAIEYTPAKGTIKISLNLKDGHFLITVIDTGIGIPKDEQSKIFTKFMRASNAKNVKAAGTGLGVYIAKEAVDLLKGRIWFTSEENKGTTFSVELPVESEATGGSKSFSYQEIF